MSFGLRLGIFLICRVGLGRSYKNSVLYLDRKTTQSAHFCCQQRNMRGRFYVFCHVAPRMSTYAAA